jgi:hypothetical protein
MEKVDCPLCDEELFSSVGKGCIMCGMPIQAQEEFCSEKCKKTYIKIRSIKVK